MIGRPEDLQIVLEITILEIVGTRVRLGFTADTKTPIHRREIWDRICNGDGHEAGEKPRASTPSVPARPSALTDGRSS